MRKSGWTRLWVVVSLPFVPAAAYLSALPAINDWYDYMALEMNACRQLEAILPSHPSGHDCQQQYFNDGAMYQYLHTTFLGFWSKAAAIGVVSDLVLTLLVMLVVWAVVWVRRGFNRPATRSPGQ